jgi:hypothetical protein
LLILVQPLGDVETCVAWGLSYSYFCDEGRSRWVSPVIDKVNYRWVILVAHKVLSLPGMVSEGLDPSDSGSSLSRNSYS